MTINENLTPSETAAVTLEPLKRMVRKDIRAAVSRMSPQEARYLVDLYYQIQESRKAAGNQTKAALKGAEPCDFLQWAFTSLDNIEETIKRGLDDFTRTSEVAMWSRSICGIGEVLSAGLIAHIDVTKSPTVGHIWRFAGLDPTDKWEKGEKRPWNASLKVLCWKIGESFVKVSGNDNDIYGKVWAKRKELEESRNNSGQFADQAAAVLKEVAEKKRRLRKTTEAYKAYQEGKLPAGQIHARAKRYAVKLFLAHWHHVAYALHYKQPPPKPYIIEHGGHVHFIGPPHFNLETLRPEY